MIKILILSIFILLTQEQKSQKENDLELQNKMKRNTNRKTQQIFEIANYNYPTLNNTKDNYIVIPILATSDIHGYLIKKDYEEGYSKGGYNYFGTYLNTLLEDWGDRLIYINSGDNYQGGYESKLSKGEIMNEFFRYTNMSATTLGNHEFDYGEDYLVDKLNTMKDLYVIDNVFEVGHEDEQKGLENTVKDIIVEKQIDGVTIKIGFIGITTMDVIGTSASDLDSYVYFSDQFKNIIEDRANKLRNEDKVNAVVLIAHSGVKCNNADEIKTSSLGIFDKTNSKNCDVVGEMSSVMSKLNEGAVDLILGGHTHLNIANFFNGFPFVSPVSNLYYFNIPYLYFDKQTGKLLNDLTKLEGPIPVCSKVYSNYGRCGEFTDEEKNNLGELIEFSFHGKKIEEDTKIVNALKNYTEEVEIIGKEVLFLLIGNGKGEEYGREKDKEFFLGNLVTDAFREETGADFAFMNNGGFKNKWSEGNITISQFYNMLPYDNYLISFKITGKELKDIMEGILFQEGSAAQGVYGFSGAVIALNNVTHKIINMTFSDSQPLKENKTYLVASNDYLMINYGDDMNKFKGKLDIKDVKYYGFQYEVAKKYLENHPVIKVSDYFDPINSPRLINTTEEESSSSPSSDNRNYDIILNNQYFIKNYLFFYLLVALLLF